jgi:hypothetical protein
MSERTSCGGNGSDPTGPHDSFIGMSLDAMAKRLPASRVNSNEGAVYFSYGHAICTVAPDPAELHGLNLWTPPDADREAALAFVLTSLASPELPKPEPPPQPEPKPKQPSRKRTPEARAATREAREGNGHGKPRGNGGTAPDAGFETHLPYTPEEIVALFGAGTINANGWINVPGPGHSLKDRTLWILIDPAAPHGFRINSFACDDWRDCVDYVLETLGDGVRKEIDLSPEKVAEREAARKRLAEEMEAKRAAKAAEWKEIWDKAHPVTAAEKDKAHIAGQGVTKPWALPHDYLAGRGLTVPNDEVFRWREKHHYGKRNKWGGTVRPGSMLARIIDARTSKVIGYHQTFLDDFGKKTSFGMDGGNWAYRLTHVGFKGGVIQLCDADPGVDVVGIGEGIESALSIRELPEGKGAAIFAAVNAYNFDELPVPKNHKRVLVAIDIEPSGVGSKKAKDYAYLCACHNFNRKAGKGEKDVQLIVPTIPGFQGKADLNDVIQTKGGFRNGEHYKLEKVITQAVWLDFWAAGQAAGARLGGSPKLCWFGVGWPS